MKKNKIKQIIFKFLLVNDTIFLLYILLCAFFRVFFSWSKFANILYDNINYVFILFLIFGWAMVLYTLIFNVEFVGKKSKPFKIDLIVKTHKKLVENISGYLLIKGFYEFELVNYNSFQIKMFYKIKNYIFLKRIDFIILIMKDQLEKGDLELFDEKINGLIDKNLNNFKSNVYSYTPIICVNKNSNIFRKYINTNVIQSFKIFKLPVGILYEDSKIFIAKQKDGPAIAQYKKLKKFFMKLIEKCNC